MQQHGTGLAPFYKGWDAYQGLLVRAIEPLSPEQLAMRLTPSLRTIENLAAHIVGARARWFHDTLGEGDQALDDLVFWGQEGEPPRSATELAGGLEVTWGLIQDSLGRWTPAMLDDPFTSRRGRAVTRQWVIWHVIEHDLHHGGELFFTLGAHGLPTPDL